MSEEKKVPNKGGGSVALYKEEYDQLLIAHMSQGYSFESFGADVGCGRRTLFDWADRYPSFRDAQREGYERGKKLFEGLLIAKMRGIDAKGMDLKKSDTACLIFALKTRYRDTYSEKVEVAHSGDVKINIDSDDSTL